MLDVCMVHHPRREIPARIFDLCVKPPFCRILLEVDGGALKGLGWQERVAQLRTVALARVRTPFWLSLDDDVRLEPRTLQEALGWLREHREAGGLGIDYVGPERGGGVDVHMGCALWRTEATYGLAFRTFGATTTGCECHYFGADLRARGWTVTAHPTLRAAHIEDGG